MSEQELFGILDAIKNLTGEYRARGQEMEIEPKKSKWGNFQAKDEDGYLVYNDKDMRDYDVQLSEQDVVGILQALSAQPSYRPIETSPDPMDFMDFEAQVMKRYPQFFGGR